MNFEATSIVALLVIPLLLSIAGTAGTLYVQRAKIRADLRAEFMAENVVRRLLEVKKYRRRHFETIKKLVGGFSDDELRKILLRAGALRFRVEGDSGRETWGLISRNMELVGFRDDAQLEAGEDDQEGRIEVDGANET